MAEGACTPNLRREDSCNSSDNHRRRMAAGEVAAVAPRSSDSKGCGEQQEGAEDHNSVGDSMENGMQDLMQHSLDDRDCGCGHGAECQRHDPVLLHC